MPAIPFHLRFQIKIDISSLHYTLYKIPFIIFVVRPATDELTPYATYHLNNCTELQTFQQRTSAPAGQTAATVNKYISFTFCLKFKTSLYL